MPSSWLPETFKFLHSSYRGGEAYSLSNNKQLQKVKTMTEEEKNEVREEAPAETPAATEAPAARARDDNVVFVGKKGAMGYVLAVVTQFNNGATEVSIKARGKLISRAVDVAEIVKNRFMPDVKVTDIAISTEELTSEDGSKNKVSAMEIILKK